MLQINENGGKYQGMDRYTARKQIVEDLNAGGYLVRVEPIKHNVGTCYRCHETVEPRVSRQWFVKMAPLGRTGNQGGARRRDSLYPRAYGKSVLQLDGKH